jgi:hypothetical protein
LLLGGGEAGVLADGPGPHRVHRGLRAADEGLEAGQRVGVGSLHVGRGVQRLDGDALGRRPVQRSQVAAGGGLGRGALKVLAVEGLVTMKVRRGAYVTEMSRDDVAQVYHLLALLESDAAGEVAASADEAQRAELRSLHERLEKQVRQRDAFFATNEQFHMALLAIAGNRWRTQIVTDLRKVMKLNRHHSLFKQGRLADSLAEHRAMMAAIDRAMPRRPRA